MSGWKGSVDNRPGNWHAIRARILARDPLCRLRYDVCAGRSTEVDHVVPRARGGGHDDSNLQGACSPCHARKTIADRPVQRRPAEQHPGVKP